MAKRNTADSNQPEIVEGLRKFGASVFHAGNVGAGFPDIVVGYNGQNYLMEIKTEKGELSDSQKLFIEKWFGKVYVIRSLSRAIEIIREGK